MANIARLGVVLGIDTAEFTKGLNAAKKSLGDFANKIPVVAAAGAAAFAAMAAKSLEFADHISDLADANEMSIASILKMSEALEMSGGRAKDAGKLLATFTSKIDEAAQGSNAAQNTFSRIGISLKDIAKLSNEDLFEKTLDQLSKIGDVATRNALAFTIFGKAIRGVDVKAFREEMKGAREEFEKYEDAIRTSGALHDQMAKKTTMLMLNFNQNVMPTLAAMFDSLNKQGGVADWAFEKMRQGLIGLWYVAGSLKGALSLVNLEWELLKGNISKSDFIEQARELTKEQLEFKKKLNDLDKPAAVIKKPKDEVNRPVVDAQEQAIKNAKLLSEEFEKQQVLKYEQLKRQKELVVMTTNERQVAEAVYKIEDDRFNKIAEIQKKIKEEEAKKPSDRQQGAIDEMKRQINIINETAEAYKRLTEEEIKAQQEQQRTFSFGWNNAFRQYAEDATNFAKIGGDVFKSVTQSMEDAIVNFVKTGKLSFKSFAQSVIAELLNIQARAIAVRAVSGIMGGLFGPGNALSGIGAIFAPGSDVGPPVSAMPRASGGDITEGKPYLVGENGPELVIPSRNGTVIPNGSMNNALGGSTTINNYNINAIDTKSFEERLYGSSNAIWAANTYAQKNMSVSRSRT